MMMVKLKIEVEEECFDLEKAICNHGLFMTPPNQWIPHTKTFRRPLRLADGCSSVMVSITSPSTDVHSNHIVVIQVHNRNSLSPSDQHLIQKQVIRMLRLTNKDKDDVTKFHEMHGEAKTKGFGRLFRSPDLFEDLIKTILLCCTTWKRTLEMCEYLCEFEVDEMHNKSGGRNLDYYFRSCKRKRDNTRGRGNNKNNDNDNNNKLSIIKPVVKNFPNSKELAGLSEEYLQRRCKLGYRAKYVLEMAKLFEKGNKLRLGDFEETIPSDFDCEKLHNRLLKLKGIGPFGAANILMCMGDYRNIPTDSETLQHLHQVHGIDMIKCKRTTTVATYVKQVYDRFGPYQCLAYWYEKVESYESSLGKKLSDLAPSDYYKVAVGSYLSSNIVPKE